jgi:polyhydroxybutyrate depolymerase
MKPFSLLLLCVTLFSSCKKGTTTGDVPPADKPSEQKVVNLTIDGTPRSFIVYLPSGYNNVRAKMPMIFALHGGSGSGSGMLSLADFRPIAEANKIVLVYPDGTQTSWNDGRPTAANVAGINDVSFFSQVCDYMVTNNNVDATRIYATGISNGGFMSSRLGCELSAKIAATAVDAASIEQNTVFSSCNPGRPVPTLYIQGTLDPLVPFTGGTVVGGAGGAIVSHAQAIAKWIAINGCSTTPVVNNLPDIANDGTTITQRIYTGGTNGSEVVSYVILNGGHTWPQGLQYLPEAIIGKTSQDMNACQVIWDFFKRFKR